MSDKGCVTLECSVILVRAHPEPAVFGEYAPFDDAFTLVQVSPGVFEAKTAKGVMLTPSQRRSLAVQLLPLGGKEVFYTRHKPGKPPYAHRFDVAELAKNRED